MNTAEEFLLKELKPRSGNLRTGVMNNDYAAKLMEEYANQQTADLRENRDWLAKELVKMQDSLTSCQGELQALQNEHRKLREAICNTLNDNDLLERLADIADIKFERGGSLKLGYYRLKEQEDKS